LIEIGNWLAGSGRGDLKIHFIFTLLQFSPLGKGCSPSFEQI
jgi:hypothetical protein